MVIAYHVPSTKLINAYRTIYQGYKNAFIDLGHTFHTITANIDIDRFLSKNKIDIFITSSHYYYQRYLDLDMLLKYRRKGMKLFTKIDFWKNTFSKFRFNEAPGLETEKDKIKQIQNGLLGDVFFHTVEQNDQRMDGFEKVTKKKFITIPLAFDKLEYFNEYNNRYTSDIAYVGTNLPGKKQFFKENVFPLQKKYLVKIYGQDWTMSDVFFGLIHKLGQYGNIPLLTSIKKAALELSDERQIYSSSKILINVHEDYQRRFGGDCNERTFKILGCGGFEIVDNVGCIRQYFKDNEEIVIASNEKDWHEKIDYFMKHPELRLKIAEKGKQKALRFHTYHHRVKKILELFRAN